MARVQLTQQALSESGTVPGSIAGHADGHSFDPGDIVEITNGSGGVLTVTLQTPATPGGLALAEHTFTIANGAREVIAIPKAKQRYFARPLGGSDPGLVWLDLSTTTSVTLACLVKS